MTWPLRVLLVADATCDTGPMMDSLRRGGFEPHWTRVDSEAALRVELLLRAGWQVILCDFGLQELEALQALAMAKALSPDLPFIIVAAPIGDAAACALRAGAADCVTLDNLARLPAAVARELEQAAVGRQRRLAELHFRGLIERMPLGIIVHRDRRILYANQICLLYLGLDRLPALLARDPLELVAAPDRARVGQRLAGLH